MLFKVKIHKPYTATSIIVEAIDIKLAIAHVIQKEYILAYEILSVKTIFIERQDENSSK